MRTSNENHLAALYRVSFGLLTLFALVVQYLTAQAHPPFNRLNFFSYFTTLGNLLGAVVFLRVGLGTRRTLSVEWMRGAATLYLSVVFVVYGLLLSDIPLGVVRPWVNTVLHQFMPVAALLDWVCAPPKHRLELRWRLLWLAFPLLFLLYTLFRGASIDWYPYPFLDPGRVGGYASVAAYCVGILVVFVLFAALLTWLGDYLLKQRTPIASKSEK
jgi:hypothetical protein